MRWLYLTRQCSGHQFEVIRTSTVKSLISIDLTDRSALSELRHLQENAFKTQATPRLDLKQMATWLMHMRMHMRMCTTLHSFNFLRKVASR
jgi:hypothetical protein